METTKRMDGGSRKRLAKFMIKVSQGYTILPNRETFQDEEIKMAVLKKYNKPYQTLERFVIKKGISHMFHRVPTIKGNIPQKVKEKLIETLENQESLLLLLMSEKPTKTPLQKKKDDELIQQLEVIRNEDKKIKDNNMRKNIALIKYYSSLILPKIYQNCKIFGLDPYQLFRSNPPNKQEIRDFYKSIQSAYSFVILTQYRDIQKDRPIQQNDLNDIGFLSIAIPYCDVVITEKMWVSLAKSAGLDTDFNTLLLPSIKELLPYLERL